MAEIVRDGVRLRYDVHGDGEPLLCIMGLAAASGWWYPQVEGLADRYRLITFDNRGAGDSEAPPGPYTMSALAGCLMHYRKSFTPPGEAVSSNYVQFPVTIRQ